MSSAVLHLLHALEINGAVLSLTATHAHTRSSLTASSADTASSALNTKCRNELSPLSSLLSSLLSPLSSLPLNERGLALLL
jgi:hypothetical protein